MQGLQASQQIKTYCCRDIQQISSPSNDSVHHVSISFFLCFLVGAAADSASLPSCRASGLPVEVSVEESCEKLKAAADRQKSILLELVSRLQSSRKNIGNLQDSKM